MHTSSCVHDDVIKWEHFPCYWPFVRGIHRSPVNSPHKGQWRGALMFSLICVWINGLVNNLEAGDLSRHRAHYDVIIMLWLWWYEPLLLSNETDGLFLPMTSLIICNTKHVHHDIWFDNSVNVTFLDNPLPLWYQSITKRLFNSNSNRNSSYFASYCANSHRV